MSPEPRTEPIMDIESAHILSGMLIGMGATLLMDLWNLLLRHAFDIPSLDDCLLGRWVRHMPGAFRHPSIAKAAPKTGECGVGWIAHYSIGISLALAFVLASGEWLARPTLLPALLYDIATVAFPFLVLQPFLGLGIASSKAAKALQARIKSLATHAAFGCGLYVCAAAMAT